MNKSDLIIDALELYTTERVANNLGRYVLHNCCGQEFNHGHYDKCLAMKALAAARELRELKPVAWRYEISGDAVFTDSPKREEIVRMTGIEATPLFALEQSCEKT
jgi:hypothetical protein